MRELADDIKTIIVFLYSIASFSIECKDWNISHSLLYHKSDKFSIKYILEKELVNDNILNPNRSLEIFVFPFSNDCH